MSHYNDIFFLNLAFDTDALLLQNWTEEGHRGRPLAEVNSRTLNAIAKCFGIAAPAIFLASSVSTVLGVQIEARRHIEAVFSRHKTFLAGTSPQQEMSARLANLLTLPAREIDDLIAKELGIRGRKVLARDVVAAGGMSLEDLLEHQKCWF